MKRIFEVTAKGSGVTVTISGVVEASPGCFVRNETDQIRDNLADAVMKALASAPYVHSPLCKLRVK